VTLVLLSLKSVDGGSAATVGGACVHNVAVVDSDCRRLNSKA